MSKITGLSIALVTLFTFWVGRDLMRPEFPRTHDGLYHVVRLHQFDLSLTSGQFPVRWAPTLLNGLGYPVFVVNYTLPYYLAELFYLLSGSLLTAIKTVLLLSLVAAALTGFFLFRSWTHSRLAAIIGAVFYTLAPYRLANVFERGALGESVAYVFVPLLFLGIKHLIDQKQVSVLVLATAGLILSHTVVWFMFTPLALAYLLLFSTRLSQDFGLFIKGNIVALSLTAFQLFPIIFERRFMNFDAQLFSAYQGHFKSLYQLLRIPVSGVNIGTRFQIGLIHSLVVTLTTFLILKRKLLAKPGVSLQQKNKLITFFLLFFIISVSLVTPASQFLWDYFLPLRSILYPWRFLGVIAFATSAIASLLVESFHRYRLILASLLIILVIFTNRHYLKADAFEPSIFPEDMLQGNATTQDEFTPIGFSPQAVDFAQPQLESLDQPIFIDQFLRLPSRWSFTAQSSHTSRLKLGLLYFPGWTASLNGQPISMNTQVQLPHQDLRGLIVLQIPPGFHDIEVRFRETPLRQAANFISLITLILFIFLVKKRQARR